MSARHLPDRPPFVLRLAEIVVLLALGCVIGWALVAEMAS